MKKAMFKKKKGGKFTLIELLVVIAIIAILAAMLMPALGRARTAAYRTASVSNVRQLATIMHFYANDYGDSLPFAGYYRKEYEEGWPGRYYPFHSWSVNLVRLGYIPGSATDPQTILWSPARNIPEGEHTWALQNRVAPATVLIPV